jgi:hypothetical protein
MAAVEAPSTLLSATLSNAKSCAAAAVHVKTCAVCPNDFGIFLDAVTESDVDRLSAEGVSFCVDGRRLMRAIRASDLEIAQAVRQPMRRELAS